jgi:hypothetical protein
MRGWMGAGRGGTAGESLERRAVTAGAQAPTAANEMAPFFLRGDA